MGLTPPLFTVLIPAHDAEGTVARAVRSALDQSMRDLEVVVVDDGSTDGTASVLRGFTDERLVLIEQAASGSPAGARNAGLRAAQGGFVAFLDADDEWYPEKLARVHAALSEDPTLDVVCHDVRLVGPSGPVGHRAYRLDARGLYEQLLYRGNFLTTSAMTVRASRLRDAGGFSEVPGRSIAEDLDLWLRLAEAGIRLRIIPETLGDYAVGEGISGDHASALRDTFDVLDRHYEQLAASGRLNIGAALVRRLRALGALAIDHLAHGRPAAGARTAAGILPDVARRWHRYRGLR